MPFVTAGEADVGISAFIGNKVTVFDENTVTVDMFGSAKYRNYKYGADDHVAVVHTEKLNKYAAIYVASAVHKKAHNGQFDYGKNFYAKDADELNIMLPVKRGSNTPDWDYMQKCVSKIEEETKARVDKYLSDNGLNSAVSEQEKQILTEKKKFAKFKIGKIVSLYSSKKKINANTVEFNGKHPYVARSSENNGIRGYIDHDLKDINAGNTISFGQDTATVFYQEDDYFTGDKIKVMEFLDEEYSLNFKLAQYIICSMRKAFAGFSWGTTSFNENILNEIQFILPIQDNIIDSTHKYHDEGYVPDWDYMEKYIDVLMRQTAARVM